jgi:predicted ribosomally synthesized peptide with SipW-like signal peptide
VARRHQLLLTALILVGIAVVTTVATYSAFSSTTSTSGNTFAAGTVLIGDNDLGSAMLALPNAKPGDSDTSCITLTYTGTLDSSVRLYATVSGGLAPYLNVTVTRGTDANPTFDSCTTFNPDSTDYIGSGNGVVYQGTLSGFPTSYAAGLVDPTSGSPETWQTDEVHVYRFVISLANDNGAQGQTATAGFTWEARNQ